MLAWGRRRCMGSARSAAGRAQKAPGGRRGVASSRRSTAAAATSDATSAATSDATTDATSDATSGATSDHSDHVARLLRWAASDALRLSPRVRVGAPRPGAPRGVFVDPDGATPGGVKAGDEVLVLPNSCTAFDAEAAYSDVHLGLKDAIETYEARDDRGGDVTPEIALALRVALAARHPTKTPFGPYAEALPREPPDTPLLLSDDAMSALLPVLPLSLVDAIDAARQDLYQLWDVAAAVMGEEDTTRGP